MGAMLLAAAAVTNVTVVVGADAFPVAWGWNVLDVLAPRTLACTSATADIIAMAPCTAMPPRGSVCSKVTVKVLGDPACAADMVADPWPRALVYWPSTAVDRQKTIPNPSPAPPAAALVWLLGSTTATAASPPVQGSGSHLY